MFTSWLSRWLSKARLFKSKEPNTGPSREEIDALPVFQGLRMEDIVVVGSDEGAARAVEELMKQRVVGFDTESKPTFLKGQVSTGPHIAQFSTMNRAFVFLLQEPGCRSAVRTLMAAPALEKVGFGLGDDLKRIRLKLSVEPRSVVDLETMFRSAGYRRGIGVKTAVAIALKKRFQKSRKTTTSNWAAHALTDKQITYAANDAYASICVYNEMIQSGRKNKQ